MALWIALLQKDEDGETRSLGCTSDPELIAATKEQLMDELAARCETNEVLRMRLRKQVEAAGIEPGDLGM